MNTSARYLSLLLIALIVASCRAELKHETTMGKNAGATDAGDDGVLPNDAHDNPDGDSDNCQGSDCDPPSNDLEVEPEVLPDAKDRTSFSLGQMAVDLARVKFPPQVNNVAVGLSKTHKCENLSEIVESSDLTNPVSVTPTSDGEYFVCFIGKTSSGKVVFKAVNDTPTVVDVTAPAVTQITSQTVSTTTGTAQFELAVTDFSNYEVAWELLPANANGTLTSNENHNAELTLVQDGTFTVSATVTDEFANKTKVEWSVFQDRTAPTVPQTALSAANLQSASALITWNAAIDGIAPSEQISYLGCIGSSPADVSTLESCLDASHFMGYTLNKTEASIANLAANTTYYLNIIAKDPTGNASIYAAFTLTTLPDQQSPTIGSFSSTENTSSSGFKANWTAATDDHTLANAIQYYACSSKVAADVATIESCKNTAQLELAYSANVLTFTASGKEPSTAYYVNVIAKDAAGNEAIYTPTTVTTLSDETPPTAGSMQAATSIGIQGATINWTKATDDHTAQNNIRYVVCVATTASTIDSVDECRTAALDTFTANITNFVVSGLDSNTDYFARAVARDSFDNDTLYAQVSFKTLANSPVLAAPSGTISFEVDAAITPVSFANTGGTVTACSVEPDLPAGLLLGVHAGTCRLTGTPTALTAEDEYSLEATSTDGGKQTLTFDLEVIAGAGTWEIPDDESDNLELAGAVWGVKTAISSNGDAIVTWGTQGGVHTKLRINSTWGASEVIPFSLPYSNTAVIAAAANAKGHFAIMYNVEYNPYVSTYVNGTWSHPTSISDKFFSNEAQTIGDIKITENDDVFILARRWVAQDQYIMRLGHRLADGTWAKNQDVGHIFNMFHAHPKIALTAAGDAYLAFKAESFGNLSKVCIASYVSSTWTLPSSLSDCYFIQGRDGGVNFFSLSTSPNGRVAFAYISVPEGNIYLHEFDGTTWTHPSDVNDYLLDKVGFDGLSVSDISISNSGDINLLWRAHIYQDEFNSEPHELHSYRKAGVWYHPPKNAANRIFAQLATTDKVIALHGAFTTSGKGVAFGAVSDWPTNPAKRIVAGSWTSQSWTSLATSPSTFFVPSVSYPIFKEYSTYVSDNGLGIVVWVQSADTYNNSIFAAIYE